jgi:hypothetical protein
MFDPTSVLLYVNIESLVVVSLQALFSTHTPVISLSAPVFIPESSSSIEFWKMQGGCGPWLSSVLKGQNLVSITFRTVQNSCTKA